ncbi:MAG: hypothetical protein ABH950_04280 [Candidatus Altiarchaeota archaeon]
MSGMRYSTNRGLDMVSPIYSLKNLTVVLLALLTLSSMVGAQTVSDGCFLTEGYSGEDYYHTANEYYISDYYPLALCYTLEARDVFEEDGNQEGLAKTLALESAIAGHLTENRLAGMFYSIAGDYYLDERYTASISRALKALEIYEKLNQTADIYKTNDLITAAKKEIEKNKGDIMERANLAFLLAKKYFRDEDYYLARDLGKNASNLYSQVPYQPGKDNADTLMDSSEKKLQEMKQNADVLFDTANDYYVAKDLDKAEIPASKALEFYKKLRDEGGIQKCENLIRRILIERGQKVNDKLVKADLFFQDAENFFIKRDCQNATYWVLEARDLYAGLYNDASSLTDKREQKQLHDFYQSLINKCNKLLGQIQEECGREIIKQQAENAYLESQKNLLQNNYRLSVTYAQKARGLCSQIEDFVCVAKVENLITEINSRVEEKQKADALLEEAEGFYDSAEFQNALLKSEEALVVYKAIWHKELQEKVESFKEEIYVGLEKRDEAEKFHDKAQQYFETQNFEKTVEYATKAREIYLDINMTLGIAGTDALISNSQEVLDERARQRRNQMLIIGGLIIAGGAIIIFVWKKKKDLEEDAELRYEEDRRIKIREEEEWEIEKQEETEKRVKEELEAILKRERSELEKEE